MYGDRGGTVDRTKVKLGDLFLLLVKPAVFFRDRDLDVRSWFLLALYCTGVTTASSRIDTNLIRADLGHPRSGWETMAPLLLDSWLAYWAFILGAGLLSAALYWYVGGWWYKVRVKWSGASSPDPREARLIMVSAAFVMSAPTILMMLLDTLQYPNYRASWDSDSLLPILFLVFPFWSVYASYRGVRTRFPVGTWRTRIWFLFLPCLFFLMTVGVIAVLYALLDPTMGAA